MSSKDQKVSWSERLGYASGDLASNLFWQTFMYFLPIFYTDVFGLPVVAAAWLFGLSRILDAVTDPTVGIIADRTKSRWGRFRPYVLYTAIPFGIIGVLTFTTPDLSINGKVIYAFITYNVMMILYTVINIPYSSLMGVITPDSQERTKISSLRFIFAFSAGLLVTAFNNPLVQNFGDMGTAQVISKQEVMSIEGKTDAFQMIEAGGKVAYLDTIISIDNEAVKRIVDEGIVVMTGDWKGKAEKEIQLDTIKSLHIADITSICEKKDFSELESVVQAGGKYLVVDNYNDEAVYLDGKLKKFDQVTLIDAEKLSGQVAAPKEATIVSQSKGYKYTVTLYAILAALLFFFTFASTKERVSPKIDQKSNIKEDLKDLGTNIPWLILLAAGIFTMFYVCIRNGAIAYYFKYFVSVKEIFGYDIASAFMVIGTVASIAGTGAVTMVAKRLGKKVTYIVLMLLSTIFTASFFVFKDDQVGLMFTFQILASLFMGPTAALVWAMYADVADYSEWKSGRRATGLIFSASTMAQKIGWAIGGVITMVVLGMVGYDGLAPTQTDTAVTGIKLLVSLIPAFISLLCAVVVFFYSLDDKTVAKMQAELAERNNK
jgi:GPH family glycoside/pentoside/hexuronide:cation symporter